MYLVTSRRLALTNGGSRPSDKRGGAGHPDPKIGGGVASKNFFWPFGPHFGLKIGGWAPQAPPLDPPQLTLPSPKGKLLLYPQLLTITILGDI